MAPDTGAKRVKADRERLVKLADPAIRANYPDEEERRQVRQHMARAMIPDEQLEAARQAGFDTRRIYYHATHKAWTSGVPNRDSTNWNTTEWGDGLYLSDSIGMALRYGKDGFENDSTIPDGAVLMAFVLRKDIRLYQFGGDGFERGKRQRLADPAGVTKTLQARGFDGAFNPKQTQLVIWNTEKTRHVGADFNPSERASRDVFA